MTLLSGIGERDALSLRNHAGRTLAFSLFDAIGRAVVTGAYDDRAFPSERDLAEGFGISLSVTREATKMLAVKGLLASAPQRGTFVQPSDQWNLFDPDVLRWLGDLREPLTLLRQLLELCATIEPEAAALAARCANPAQVNAITTGLTLLREADPGSAGALDAALTFRTAVLRASGNPFFMRCSEIVTAASNAAIRCIHRLERAEGALAGYCAVRDAIAAGEGDAASRAMLALIGDMRRSADRSISKPGLG
jgi:DNA-binding FadR family transcriptional regulator